STAKPLCFKPFTTNEAIFLSSSTTRIRIELNIDQKRPSGRGLSLARGLQSAATRKLGMSSGWVGLLEIFGSCWRTSVRSNPQTWYTLRMGCVAGEYCELLAHFSPQQPANLV